MLGLPDSIKGLLFDMDGVLTRTSEVHAKAWKQAFDSFLQRHAQQTGTPFTPFDPVKDYDAYVDGKPRYDGVRDFLASRNITLPEGEADDAADAATVHGVGNAKNEILLKLVRDDGVRPYEGSVAYVHKALEQGYQCAVVSSSANAHDVLAAAGFAELIATVIDGHVVEDEGLPGKPHPATYLRGATALGLTAEESAVFEDALAGVAAGRAGEFGYVVGLNRSDQAAALHEHGADLVVDDLGELLER